jgi:nitrite reductase (NADH) small subunit
MPRNRQQAGSYKHAYKSPAGWLLQATEQERTMTAWTLICHIEDIPVLGSRRVARDTGLDVAVFRNDSDEVFALLDRCPHKGGPLSQGIVHGRAVTCPIHAWNINLENGCAIAPDEGCARHFDVKCVDEDVFLRRDQLAVL